MSELAGRLDEVSAAAIQQEVARVVALGVGSVLAVEEEEPSERHAGPCAIRYNNNTQFDISTITSSFSVPNIRHPLAQKLAMARPRTKTKAGVFAGLKTENQPLSLDRMLTRR